MAVAVLQQPCAGWAYTIAPSGLDGMGAFDMRKLLPGSMALIALGLSIPAMAADLEVGGPAYKATRPVVRAYDWTGFYVGGNVGGHWGTDKITTVTDPTTAGATAIDAASPPRCIPKASSAAYRPATISKAAAECSASRSMPLAGRLGHQDTDQHPVIAPTDAMIIRSRPRSSPPCGCAGNDRVFRPFAILRDRRFCLRHPQDHRHDGALRQHHHHFDQRQHDRAGFGGRGGFEYAFTDNISAKLEYLYVAVKNVGTTIPATAAGGDSIAVNHDYSDHIGRFGLNFKFGG